MSACFGCFFHEGGFMYNRCNYFEMEYFGEKDKCSAFTVDGNLSAEAEAEIFDKTDGVFGKPRNSQQEYEVKARYNERKEE